MSKIVLGKGLGALIPDSANATAVENKYRMVGLESIAPNPMQPRREFDEAGLSQLAASLKKDGLMQPLVVRHNGSGYTIIAGERRFRAAKLAGFTQVPVVLMDESDDYRLLQLALVENLQREDLNPMEVAEALRSLLEKGNLTQNEVAVQVGKSRASVANLLRLLTLPESIQQMLRDGRLSEGHARAILALGNDEERLRLAEQIMADQLSVRAAERTARQKKKRKLIPKRKIPALVEVENYLKGLLGTSVKVHPGLKRGRIEVEYYTDEDLDRLLELFRRIEVR